MNGVIDLQMWQMAASYIFIVILLFIVKARGISREKEIIISSVRMTLQLIITGYALIFLFDNANPLLTLLVIAIMEAFAINNVYKRTKMELTRQLKKIIALSMLAGTLSSLVYFLLVVVPECWWETP